jgi:hypothetical protein
MTGKELPLMAAVKVTFEPGADAIGDGWLVITGK